ncbi:hypothetical protein EIP91_000288 [Steccherinum ochraceum]|uniref:Copper transporter n=1 Tax=Steccherinum ochraceum TaxID=92696 RepID=A0A4R0RU55_9APHY|nr:hypothetical protein EIP91_000288 [Steccherinum ochraceum]
MHREAFDFDTHSEDHDAHFVKILPFFGNPVELSRPAAHLQVAASPDNTVVPIGFKEGSNARMERSGHHHGHNVGHHLRGDFLHRINHALVSLGTWEGRIVAFVLGCGIGVLLRMMWVLGLVLIRSVRGSREEPEPSADEVVYYEGVVLFDEADHTPPQYTAATPAPEYTDEKKAAPAADN